MSGGRTGPQDHGTMAGRSVAGGAAGRWKVGGGRWPVGRWTVDGGRFQPEIFNVSKFLPTEERFALTGQIRRSSRSIGANLAEAGSAP